MIRKPRGVGTTVDTGRLAEAVSRPGIDPRCWVSIGIVTDVFMDPESGPLADILLVPGEDHVTAKLGSLYAGSGWGIYMPLYVDDEVIVGLTSGEMGEMPTVLQRLHSPADPPPQGAVDHPDDPLICVQPGHTLRIMVSGGGQVLLGDDGLTAIQGVVQGEGIDLYSGQTYFALGNASTTVLAKK